MALMNQEGNADHGRSAFGQQAGPPKYPPLQRAQKPSLHQISVRRAKYQHGPQGSGPSPRSQP